MTPTDDELIARSVGGDNDALAELLERYDGLVRRGLRIARKWRAVLDLDDVMQVTYLEAFGRIGRFTPAGSAAFLKWLTRIAENNLRDAARGLGRAKRPPPEGRVVPTGVDDPAGVLTYLVETCSTPSRFARRGESKRILEEAIGRLPQDYQTVIQRYDMQGQSAAEVAAAMGRTQGAVYMLRARAHDQLREILGSESRFFSDAARVR